MGYDAWVDCRCPAAGPPLDACPHPGGRLIKTELNAWQMAELHELARVRQLPTLQAWLPHFNGGEVPIDELPEFRAELAAIAEAPSPQTVLHDAATGAELARFADSTSWWWRHQGHGADVAAGRVHVWAPGGPDLWTSHFGWTPGQPATIQPLDQACEPLAWFGPELATEVRVSADNSASAAVARDIAALLEVVHAGLATRQPVCWG